MRLRKEWNRGHDFLTGYDLHVFGVIESAAKKSRTLPLITVNFRPPSKNGLKDLV